MLALYPATYRDAYGEENIVIENDGDKLRTVIRGVELEACDPDGFSPVGSPLTELLSLLPLHFGDLCSYVLDFDIPIEVVADARLAEELLHLRYELGNPRGDGSVNRGLDREDITASLTYDDLTFTTRKRHDSLEDAIDEVQAALPAGAYIKVCLNCAFGLESEMGCGGFASLGCFRDVKEEARQVRNNFDAEPLWDRKTEFVQGLHVCPQFEKRTVARP